MIKTLSKLKLWHGANLKMHGFWDVTSFLSGVLRPAEAAVTLREVPSGA
jgi:hypothetical protein